MMRCLLLSVLLVGCGAAGPPDPEHAGAGGGAGTDHPWLEAVTVADLAPIVPDSAEAAAATKPRGDGVFVDGSLVYRGATAGLVITELEADGKQLLERAVVYLPGAGNDVLVRDGIAYVACGSAGIALIDVGDPAAPKPLALIDTPGSALRLSVAGNLLAVADGALGVVVLDLSDPRRPTPRAAWRTDGAYVRQALWDGDELLAAAGRAGVYRLALADGPELEERWRMETGGQARAVAAGGGNLLVADGPGGLSVIDPGAGDEPRKTGGAALADMARDVAVSAAGGHAFVASGDDGIIVFDLSAPGAPKQVAEHVPTKPANRILRQDDRLYVGNDSDGLLVLDVSTATSPTRVFPPAE